MAPKIAFAALAALLLACTDKNPNFATPAVLPTGGTAGPGPTSDAGREVAREAGGDVITGPETSSDDGAAPEPDSAAPQPDSAVDGSAGETAAPDAGVTPDLPPPPIDLSPPADTAIPGGNQIPAGTFAAYGFEGSTQGWDDIRHAFYQVPKMVVTSSTERAWEGTAALRLPLSTTVDKDKQVVGLADDSNGITTLAASRKITMHLWVPGNAPFVSLQPFVWYHKVGETGLTWGGTSRPDLAAAALVTGWNTIEHTVPADARKVLHVGLELQTRGAQTVTVYLDGVWW